MKERVIESLRGVAPGVLEAGVRVKGTLPATRRSARGLADEVAALREQVKELRAELDELRRDSLRVAELADIVEHRLADGSRG